MKNVGILLFAFFLMFEIQSIEAQVTKFDSTAIYNIETVDGNTFQGKILSLDKETIEIETKNLGIVKIPQKEVRRFKTIKANEIVDGEYWYDSPYSTRYFYSPNGYGLKKGEGYYQNTWVLFNQVSYGFTDNFTLGLGTVPLFLFGQTEGTPFWITPKVTMPIKENKVNLMGGALVGTAIGAEGNFGGLLYTGATFGPPNTNGTLGLGWGFLNGEVGGTPVVSLSFMHRFSRRFYFMTENYFITADGETLGLISAGGRLAYQNIAVDFGLFKPTLSGSDESFFIALPWLGVHIPFGKR